MNELVCANCGVKTVNGSWTYCDECEQELKAQYEEVMADIESAEWE